VRIDFGRTAEDYARYRAGFPEEFFARLQRLGIGKAGERALDIGTGTGSLARGLARGGCEVVGLDPSPELIASGLELEKQAGVRVRYVLGVAEAVPFRDRAFDLVTAGQCWHWFDRSRAAEEVYRVLIPGGTLVIAHFDWVPLPENVVEATEQLILKHNPPWHMAGGTGMYPAWLADVSRAGFAGIETFTFDLCVYYSHEAWRGRIRACNGVGASLSPDQVRRFDAELKALLEERFPADPISVPHRVFTLTARKPA